MSSIESLLALMIHTFLYAFKIAFKRYAYNLVGLSSIVNEFSHRNMSPYVTKHEHKGD